MAHLPDSGVGLNMSEFDQRFLCRSCLAQTRADAASAAGRIARDVLGEPYAPGTGPVGPLARPAVSQPARVAGWDQIRF